MNGGNDLKENMAWCVDGGCTTKEDSLLPFQFTHGATWLQRRGGASGPSGASGARSARTPRSRAFSQCSTGRHGLGQGDAWALSIFYMIYILFVSMSDSLLSQPLLGRLKL